MGDAGSLGWWGVPLAIVGGAIRVGTPLLWVSLGETVTEKAGRINLGLEGTLLMGAMTAFGVSLASGLPWLGVLAAAFVGLLLGALVLWRVVKARKAAPAPVPLSDEERARAAALLGEESRK